jgi:hypothetical protein
VEQAALQMRRGTASDDLVRRSMMRRLRLPCGSARAPDEIGEARAVHLFEHAAETAFDQVVLALIERDGAD